MARLNIRQEGFIMSQYSGPNCAVCGIRACSGDPGSRELPGFCPMPHEEKQS